MREHLLCTPNGRIAGLVHVPGRRHDVLGLYALLHTSFQGQLIGDNAYWPQEKMDRRLVRAGILMTADTRKGFTFQYPPEFRAELKRARQPIERFIAQFDAQFNAGCTLNRSERHYYARRATKALASNTAQTVNLALKRPAHSFCYLHAVA